MTGLGVGGAFAAGDARFYSAAGATGGHDADDRVVYDSSSGQLFYDADGSGAGAAQLIATFRGPSPISASDIVVDNGTAPPAGPTFHNTLEVRALPLSGDIQTDSLLSGIFEAWDRLTASDHTLQYTFSVTEGTFSAFHSMALSANDQAATRQALAQVTTITGIRFQEVTDGNAAQWHFAQSSDQPNSGWMTNSDDIQLDSAGHLTHYDADGYVYLHSGMGDATPGTFAYQTLLHEIGHTLGLKHPHDGLILLSPALDDNHHTVMTYQDIYPPVSDFQPIDVAALQWLYGGDGLGGRGAYADGSLPQFGTEGADSLVGGAGADYLRGEGGNDTLRGGAGNDLLVGGFDGASNVLDGGDGDDRYFVTTSDTLIDSSGNDWVYAALDWTLAPGFENLQFSANNLPLAGRGNDANNTIAGNDADNRITGLGGDDTLFGRAGRDVFDLSPGAGGSYGNDTIDGGFDGDTLDFSGASSGVVVDLAAGTASGGGGTVRFVSIENVIGSAFADSIRGLPTQTSDGTFNVFQGGAGRDTITGGNDRDTFVYAEAPGAANADLLTNFASSFDALRFDGSVFTRIGATDFASGDARFFAAAGATAGHDANDRIVYNTSTGDLYYDADGSGAGAAQLVATLQGAPGLDGSQIHVFNGQPDSGNGALVTGTSSDDTLSGGTGDDTILGLGGNDSLGGDVGNDSMDGGAGNDTLFGDAGNDTLLGGDGDDVFQFAGNIDYGHDSIDGGAGNDAISFDNLQMQSGVLINLGAGTLSGGGPGGSGSAVFTGIENAVGGRLDDHIIGSAGANSLSGGILGNDTLEGGAGNDTLTNGVLLDGGDGNDTLYAANNTLIGGAGADSFVFSSRPSGTGAASISDFASGSDKIHLDARAMRELDVGGNFAAGDARFYAAAGATAGHDADDRVVFNTSTGQVFYDPDGSGSAASNLLATLQPGATLTATDIVVDFGNSPGVTLNGTGGDDSLTGGGGNDSLNGLGGNDTLEALAGNDRLDGGDGNDALNGGDGFDLELGGAGNDVLYGSGGTDARFSPAPDLDTLDGGAGDDLYIADSTVYHGFNVEAEVVLRDSGGVDTVLAKSGEWILDPGFENLVLDIDRSYDFDTALGYGNALDNVIVGFNGHHYASNELRGAAGNDTLVGGLGDHATRLFGDDGNDVLYSRGEGDMLTGGAGADRFVLPYFTEPPYPEGQVGPATITDFASGADKVVLDSRTHANLGAQGDFSSTDARFYAAAGAISGHDADDRVIYDTSTGRLYYDADGTGAGGAALIATLQGAPVFVASDISVTNQDAPVPGLHVVMTPSQNFLRTADGPDTIEGSSAGDWVLARAGDDRILGGGGNDTLTGEEGNDTLDGGAGNDGLSAGIGNDSFVFSAAPGAANADSIGDFTSGADKIVLDAAVMGALGAQGDFAPADARFYAAAGASAGHDADDADDRVVYNTTTGQLWYDADGSGSGVAQLIATLQGNPALAATDISVINGTTGGGSGTITGTPGNDVLNGTPGDDTIDGLGGADTMNGALGNDTYFVTAGDVINDTGGIDTIVSGITWTLGAAIENLTLTGTATTSGIGNTLANTIQGSAGNNFLQGDAGMDTVVGGAGNDTMGGNGDIDWLEGGIGNDTVSGGGGQDHFVFRESGAANADVVTDFAGNWDDLRLDHNAFADAGALGKFAAGDGRFFAGAGATGGHDANDRVVYNTSTGQLYYDADGSGAGAAQLVATLQGTPAVAATDITVI